MVKLNCKAFDSTELRHLKFRQCIWDYDVDKFLEWHYWGFIDGQFIKPQIDGIDPKNNYQSQQYTGYGKIYEGDILEYVDVVNGPDFKITGIVQFLNESRTYLQIKTFHQYKDRVSEWENLKDVKILGNVCENQDILNYYWCCCGKRRQKHKDLCSNKCFFYDQNTTRAQ